jgi:hypothetical protein
LSSGSGRRALFFLRNRLQS